ncbi:MAG TPA: class I SAM-dependent methyltransferase, partial [Turneriella sp.]|nr:class I SAM-dependent methyltransferase [Turneriella sp.]
MLEKNHYPPLSEKITPQNLTRLNAYADLLFSEAMPAGFIGDCTRDDIDTRHILDALWTALAPESCAVFPLASTRPLNVFDLGAGAGLPSLPLAILFSQHTFHLIDAQEKRLRFIAEALPKLGLTNVKLYHCVVQDFTKKFIDAHTADIIIFRAFRKVLASLELALNVLKAVESGGENPKVLYWRSQKIPFTERG